MLYGILYHRGIFSNDTTYEYNRRQGFGQWMNSSIIHDDICSLIHIKCHPRSYYSDIKYHMTLNIIFSVVHRPPNSWNKLCYILHSYVCVMNHCQRRIEIWLKKTLTKWQQLQQGSLQCPNSSTRSD